MALVVAAEVLLLLFAAAAEQEQVTQLGPQVYDLVLDALAAREADVEELAALVRPDVDAGVSPTPAGNVHDLSELHARAHAREPFG